MFYIFIIEWGKKCSHKVWNITLSDTCMFISESNTMFLWPRINVNMLGTTKWQNWTLYQRMNLFSRMNRRMNPFSSENCSFCTLSRPSYLFIFCINVKLIVLFSVAKMCCINCALVELSTAFHYVIAVVANAAAWHYSM